MKEKRHAKLSRVKLTRAASDNNTASVFCCKSSRPDGLVDEIGASGNRLSLANSSSKICAASRSDSPAFNSASSLRTLSSAMFLKHRAVFTVDDWHYKLSTSISNWSVDNNAKPRG